jgi:hypothetical protein
VPEGAGVAVGCPKIFDIRSLNIPIGVTVRFISPAWMHLESNVLND